MSKNVHNFAEKTDDSTVEVSEEQPQTRARSVSKEEFLAATDAIDAIDEKIKELNAERIEHNKILRRYLGRRA